jgi:hypothetical protein
MAKNARRPRAISGIHFFFVYSESFVVSRPIAGSAIPRLCVDCQTCPVSPKLEKRRLADQQLHAMKAAQYV